MATAAELIQRGREQYLDDWVKSQLAGDEHAVGQLWSDSVLLAGLNWACRKAADWALLIRDNTTPSVCEITLTAGQPDYSLHPKIVKVNVIVLAYPSGEQEELFPADEGDMDRCYGTIWRNRTGRPTHYVPKGHQIRLVPIPDKEWDGKKLKANVFRLPLADMELDDEPEIDESLQDDLIYGMCAQAYRLRSVETPQTPGMINQFEVDFMRVFGPPLSATQRQYRLHSKGSIMIQPDAQPRSMRPPSRRMW